MKEKKYKIKVSNGKIVPLEPFDLSDEKEGIIIFFDEEFVEPMHETSKEEKKLNLDWIGCLKEYRDKYTALELQKKAWE